MRCGVLLLEVLADSLESVRALVLLQSLLGHVVRLLVALLLHSLTQLLVVHLVAVLAFHVSAQFLHQFLLEAALWLDGLVGCFQSLEQLLLAHFLHLALHHHDVLLGRAHHKVDVGPLLLIKGRVDDKLAVHTGHPHFRNRAVERYIRASQCGGSRESGKCVRHVNSVGGEKYHVHVHLRMIVGREQWTERAVNEPAGEDFLVRRFAFTLCETSRETAVCRILLAILYLEWHEICSRYCIFRRANSGQEHSVAHSKHYRPIGLFCQLSRLNADFSSVRQ